MPCSQARAHVLDRLHELVHAAHFRRDDPAGRGVGHRAGVPTGARADEEADLDPARAPRAGHLVELVVGEQHHAAPLADAVDRHPERVGALVDRAQGVRPFDRGDLDPPLPAVRKALRGATGRSCRSPGGSPSAPGIAASAPCRSSSSLPTPQPLLSRSAAILRPFDAALRASSPASIVPQARLTRSPRKEPPMNDRPEPTNAA